MDDFIAYHGLQARDAEGFAFGGLETHPEGIHLGTLEQAHMRAGRGAVLKLRVHASRLDGPAARLKDRDGSWRETVRRQARRGRRLLVYLNRHEGLPTERVIQLCDTDSERLAAMPDARFRALAPEAQDSWIVLDPDLVEIVGVAPRSNT